MPDNATSPGAPPVLDLFQTGGPVPIQEVEGGWLLDLGQVAAGSLLPTFRVGVRNLAEAPADAVAVRLDVAGDPAFRIFAPDSFEAIGPQEGAGAVNTVLDTSRPGLHTATITLHPGQVSADGSVTPLPDRVLTLRQEVVGTLDAAAIPATDFTADLAPELLLTTPLRLDGMDYARIANLSGWLGSGTLQFAPDREAAREYGDAYLLATFERVEADFSAAGRGKTVEVIGAASGSLALARNDSATWSFAAGGEPGTASITTEGKATVRVTALGADDLDDRIAATSLLPYAIYPGSGRGAPTYDGSLSRAEVELGGKANTVTAEAAVDLTVTGGAGRNHVVGGGGTNLFDLTGRHDWIEAGPGQTTIIERAGSLLGDWITGFKAGDLIRFVGFGPDAALQDLGSGDYRVVDGIGRHERFHLEGVDQLSIGTDYVFA